MQQPPTGSEKEQQFLWEVLIRSQAVTFPLYVENSGLGLLANAVRSSSFVHLPNNVIGYNWGNYGLLEEAKHRCLSPGSILYTVCGTSGSPLRHLYSSRDWMGLRLAREVASPLSEWSAHSAVLFLCIRKKLTTLYCFLPPPNTCAYTCTCFMVFLFSFK